MSSRLLPALTAKLNIERANAMSIQNHIPEGTRFTSLVVIGPADPYINPISGSKLSKTLCQCDCGKTKSIMNYHLKSGASRSCGCHRFSVRFHGYVGTSTYQTWDAMIQRCNNPNNSSFKNYGAKGISVCTEWMDFRNFLRDMGEKPKGLLIERINGTLGYNKDNCKWATRKEQNRNTARNHFVTYDGKTLTIAEWAQITGIHYGTLFNRIAIGWSLERALTKPAVRPKWISASKRSPEKNHLPD